MVVSLDKENGENLKNYEVVKKMQKIRQEYAKQQKYDYSHVFSAKNRLQLMRLSCIIPGLEFAYAAETAFVSPILLENGIDHSLMTMIWGISPLLGFFLAPLMASFSDRCNAAIGKRRPFIITLGVGVILGLIMVPHGHAIGTFIGDLLGSKFQWGVFITIVGIVLLDFDAENCQTISRAYFLDVCLPEDHARILSTSTIMGGMGGCIGYMLGGINWKNTAIGDYLGGSQNTVFTLVMFIFIIGSILTLTSFREIPRPLMKKDDMLKPITLDAISAEKEKINGVFYIKTEEDLEKVINTVPEEKPMFIVQYLKNIIYMPKSLKILSLTNLFSWMSYLSFCLYFTAFVGETVFGGNPEGKPESPEYMRFEEGVRFGCWGMAIFAISCSAYSSVIAKLIKICKGKVIYIGGLSTFSLGMGTLAIIQTKWAVLVFSASAGVMYATLYTMPFLLVAQYHSNGSFKFKDGKYVKCTQNRGLGSDIAILGSMLFLAQLILSLCMGPFIALLGSMVAVVVSASFFAFLAAVTATQVVYMDL